MLRRKASLPTEVSTALAVASTAGLLSHASLVIPSPASLASSRSRSEQRCPVSRWPTRSDVSAVAPARAEVIILSRTDTPGRIVLADIRNSAARLNSSVGESCSIARSSRNCSSSFISPPPAGALFQPRYFATSSR